MTITEPTTVQGHPTSEVHYTLDKPTLFRRKLSPKHLSLPSGYRTTAWAEVQMPSVGGQGQMLEIARFHSSTAGQVEVFASQTGEAIVSEISGTEFYRLLRGDL